MKEMHVSKRGEKESQDEFIARGLRARDDAARTGEYSSVEDILQDLDQIIKDAESNATS